MYGSARKDDKGKLQWHLFPWVAAREIVKVMMFGAIKYAKYNWMKGLNYSRVWDSSKRHLDEWWDGEDNDTETGLSHLAHAGCCIMFLLTYTVLKMTFLDDRPFKKKKRG